MLKGAIMAKLSVRVGLLVLAALVVVWMGGERARAAEKLTLDQLIAKHLESLGPAEARAVSKSRASEWNARYVVKMGGQGIGEGRGVFVTEGRKLAFALKFAVND